MFQSANNIIMLLTVVSSIAGFYNPEWMMKGIFNPYTVQRRNEYQRFILSGFLHADFMHLFVNMFTLYFFGSVVEQIFTFYFGMAEGKGVYVLFYLLALVASCLPDYFLNRNNPAYNALGASGAVSAMLFACVMFAPMQEVCLYAAICIPGILYAVLYTVYSIVMARRGMDNIGHRAHLAGAFFGVVFVVLLIPGVVPHFFSELLSIF